MSMIPPPPPIPGTPAAPGVSAEIPAPPAQVNAPQIPMPPTVQPSLPPDMPAPGTVPIAQATGEIPTQIPLAVPPSPAPTYVEPVAPPSPPPVAAPVMEVPAAPAQVQVPPVVQPAPVAPVVQAQDAPMMPAMPAMPSMPAPPPIQAAPQMPAMPQAPQAYQQPQQPPQQELMPAQGQPTGMVPVQAIDYDRMSVAEIAEAMGLKGVDFTAYGTTPTISLNQGTFKTSDGSINLGTEFICRIHETRPKYLYVTRLADADPNHATAYSYDQQTSNGKSLREILDSWAQRGIAFDTKQYLEATCVLEDGRVVMLSIPFTSMSRFAGFAQSVILSRRQMADVICKVGIGPLVTKAARPFNPISFEEAR